MKVQVVITLLPKDGSRLCAYEMLWVYGILSTQYSLNDWFFGSL